MSVVPLNAAAAIVAEGLTISVRKVDVADIDIDVADVSATNAMAEMARKRALLSGVFDVMFLDGWWLEGG